MARMVLIKALILLLCIGISSGFLFKRGRRPLPIDGGWSEWKSWTSCHLNTENNTDYSEKFRGFFVSSRQRVCDSPKPLLGGKQCFGSEYKYKQCGCRNPLGMRSGRIADSQLTSNVQSMKGFEVMKGRLGNAKAWCSAVSISPFSAIEYNIDLKNFTTITAIATEGILQGRVSRFKVMYSLDGTKWTLYADKTRRNSLFIANILPNKLKLNSIHQPFIARFLKILPVHSFNRVCMKIEIYGCIFTCGKQISTSAGEIIGRSTESYNQKCLWKIDVKNTTSLSLDFVTFDIPCENGFLQIRDGSKDYQRSNILKQYCGTDLNPVLYKAPTNSLWLYYQSNSSAEEIGFRIRYSSKCFKNLQLEGNEILRITTPNYPKEYFDNNDCTWVVSSNSKKIFLLFKEFDVEASKKVGKEQCVNDFILIEEFQTGKPAKQVRYCNSNKPVIAPVPLEMSASQIRIRFKSDDAIVAKGFLLEVTSYDPRQGKPTEKAMIPPATKYPVTPENLQKNVPLATSISKLSSDIVKKNLNNNDTASSRNDTKQYPKKEKKSLGTDWTIFTVAAFSCVVFTLIVFVTVISLRKCTSRYRGNSSKFLPAVTKNVKDTSSETSAVLLRSKKTFEIARTDEQFCEMKSPAGSITVAHSEHGSDHSENEPLKADIVNHTLRREARRSFIDMYTDCATMDESREEQGKGAEAISPEPGETIL